jgi:hypothetical protein
MRDQVDKWLAGDWLFLGLHVPHWAIAMAAIALMALLVVWFERPQRAPARSSSSSASERREHSARPQFP